jgi:hypothetical protein
MVKKLEGEERLGGFGSRLVVVWGMGEDAEEGREVVSEMAEDGGTWFPVVADALEVDSRVGLEGLPKHRSLAGPHEELLFDHLFSDRMLFFLCL